MNEQTLTKLVASRRMAETERDFWKASTEAAIQKFTQLESENRTLREAGIRYADRVHELYGDLPKDRYPGPSGLLVADMRLTFSALTKD